MQTCACIIHSILFYYALATAVNCENKKEGLDIFSLYKQQLKKNHCVHFFKKKSKNMFTNAFIKPRASYLQNPFLLKIAVPLLMDKFDAAGANTRMVERLVLGSLWPTYSTNVSCVTDKNSFHIFTLKISIAKQMCGLFIYSQICVTFICL